MVSKNSKCNFNSHVSLLSSLTRPLVFFSFYSATLALLLSLKLYRYTSLLEAQQLLLWDSQVAQW